MNGLRLAPPDGQPIRRSQLRYLRAKMDLTEGGTPPTYINLAKRLGISPQALWKFRRRYPWLDEWCNRFVLADNAALVGFVQRRLALVAIQGSPDHAELFFKSVGALGGSGDQGDGRHGVNQGDVQVQQVFLVPRPEMPQLEAPRNVTSAALSVPADIPTLVVR
jgi:hypothetical protein